MSKADKFISKTIEFETGGDKSGAYHYDPSDPGGETKWGISKNANPEYKIKYLTYKRAVSIYEASYYNIYYDFISSNRIAFKLFDMGVLNGPKTIVKIYQKGLNKYRRELPKIKVDGKFGPNTAMMSSTMLLDPLKERELYSYLIENIGKRFKRIVFFRPSSKKYLGGWMKRLNYLFPED